MFNRRKFLKSDKVENKHITDSSLELLKPRNIFQFKNRQ